MASNKELLKAEKEREGTKPNLNYLEKKLAAHPVTPLSLTKVNMHLTSVARCITKIEDTFQRILEIAEAADIPPHYNEYENLLDRAQELHCKFSEIQSSLQPRPTPPPTGSGGSSGSTPDIRLPRLNLPQFDGKIEDWTSFRDVFVAAIHDNKSISNVQKLTYLKGQLRGEAARQVQSLNITDANYEIAWKQLEERYQNDRHLLFSILKRLINQPIINQPSAQAIHQLIDTSRECMRSLEVLNQPVKQWGSILLFIIHNKLDSGSKLLYEQGLKDSSIPKLQGLFDFLEQQSRALEASGGRSVVQTQAKSHEFKHNQQRKHIHHAQNDSNCKCCKETDHPLYKCSKFINATVPERFNIVKSNNFCINCLRGNHSSSQCFSTGVCRHCNGKHHTLLHRPKPDQTPAPDATKGKPILNHHTNIGDEESQTLLATAIVKVQDSWGHLQQIRVLLDGGSDSHVIREACVKKLGLKWKKQQTLITGLSLTPVGTAKGVLDIEFSPHFDHTIKITAKSTRIMPSVTGFLPVLPCNPDASHLNGISLADENWHNPAEIDMLIGASLFYNLLGGEKRFGNPDEPIALSSDIGWLVVGEVGNLNSQSNSQLHSTVMHGHNCTNAKAQHTLVETHDVDLNRILSSFWELENIPHVPILSIEERAAEQHFISTFSQDDDGRFVVKLPFKTPEPDLGSSYDMALMRLKWLERRLSRNPQHKQEYDKFMQEYLSLGHMEEIPPEEINNPNSCYIPHHFVTKESSTTTKFRVVFDASAKTSNGKSLNDNLLVGPTVQDSLFNIIIRFRTHPVAFTADIAKMYRQVCVAPPDTNYQRIIWRENSNGPIRHFRVIRVIYGSSSAPFQATRCLKQLALKHKSTFPLASTVFERDFYVDDVMSGAQTIEEAIQLQTQLIKLSSLGAFDLRKWTSSHPQVVQALPDDMKESNSLLPMETDQTVKALGIFWHTTSDSFLFRVDTGPIVNSKHLLTKRKILSDIAKLFDPIGWLAPVVISAKIVMQSLWKLDLGWDDPVPQSLHESWMQYKTDLKLIETLKIPRCMKPRINGKVALIGFCDASEKAYAAVVYLAIYPDDLSPPLISLITSKTRVCPTKSVSLPRLELCGAVILSELMESVEEAINLELTHKSCWSDSTVTLAWINAHPARFKRFVANRISEIQQRLPSTHWGYVAGTDNPADCASRGLSAAELINFDLWWKGPTFLQTGIPTPTIPQFNNSQNYEMEERMEKVCAKVMIHPLSNLLDKFSSIMTLQRVTAWMFRFVHNSKLKAQITKQENCRKSVEATGTGSLTSRECRLEAGRHSDSLRSLKTGPLQPQELEESLIAWVKVIQNQEFHAEIQSLIKEQALHPKSQIISLMPFIDPTLNVLRVGGRICKSEIPFEQKHPILLPRKSKLTELLIDYEHLRLLHAGPQLVMSSLQTKFWILRARDVIRFRLRKCVRCARLKAVTMQQLMGDLPSFRVNPARAFSKCGVDYAGPFLLRPIIPRSKVCIKAYLAIFVCCSTRAVHLELVSSLSTEAFLATLKRFISRRGRPSDIYSDCGTNFVGANRELKELAEIYNNKTHNEEIANNLSREGIQWHFNPPGAPHFGGLWESGVKSVKFHLKRVIGLTKLNFEEMTTTLTQIEAALNSRPLTPLSSDPSDFSALTPGHFLIGAPLTSAPDPDVSQLNPGRLSRWQLLQQLFQSFWHRWSNEYLTRLQQRPKWMSLQRQIKLNDLVIIKDETLPPLSWRLGRVIEVHPGPDSVIRVVTLKTQSGTLKRPITKLCLLPLES